MSDGRLTVANASGSSNNKIDYIDVIASWHTPRGRRPPRIVLGGVRRLTTAGAWVSMRIAHKIAYEIRGEAR